MEYTCSSYHMDQKANISSYHYLIIKTNYNNQIPVKFQYKSKIISSFNKQL